MYHRLVDMYAHVYVYVSELKSIALPCKKIYDLILCIYILLPYVYMSIHVYRYGHLSFSLRLMVCLTYYSAHIVLGQRDELDEFAYHHTSTFYHVIHTNNITLD